MQTEDIEIRASTPADEAGVTGLLRACYPPLLAAHYDGALLDRALPLMTQANPLLMACGTFYVAQLPSGSIVGCGGWTPDRPGTGDVEQGLGHVRHFATHPNFLRMRIGTRVLMRCIADAAAAGMAMLECYSTLGAERFYASGGFVSIDRVLVDMPGDVRFPAVLMKRGA